MMITETHSWVDEGDELRQGDIIRIIHPEADVKPFRLGVIINADCDIANNKTDGVIAFLPVYTFEDYLIEFWLPQFIGRKKRELIGQIQDLSSKWSDQNRIIESDLTEWLSDSTTEQMVDVIERLTAALNCPEKKSSDLKIILQKLHTLLKSEQQKSLEVVWKILSDSFFKQGTGSESEDKRKQRNDKEKTAVEKQFQEAQDNMGNDHLFINEIPGQNELGFVVRMRRIYSLDQKSCFRSGIAIKIAGMSPKALSALRFARLSPHYKFKLAQLFAYQYSRIGLPEENSKFSKTIVEHICSTLMVDWQ